MNIFCVENLTYFGRGLLSCIIKSFWLILWELIPFTFFAIGSLFLNLSQLKTTLLGTNISSFSIILYLIFMILFLGSILIVVIKYYSYSQMYFLVAEFDNMKMSKAMEISKIITQNHKTELFILDLSFIAWYIISFFTFGISVLFSKPYINMSKINAYHSLLKEAIDTKKRFPRNYVGWVYIYCSKSKPYFMVRIKDKKDNKPYIANGKVVARFWCDEVVESNLKFWDIEVFNKPRELNGFTKYQTVYMTVQNHSHCIHWEKITKEPPNYCYIEI